MTHASGAILRRAAAAAIALAGAVCIVASIRLSLADHLARRPGLSSSARAVALAPGAARFRLRQAALLEREPAPGSDATFERLLDAAATVEPLLAEPWMRRGLFEEIHGRPAQAEQSLLHAAAIDHTFKPSWTLANFYARHNSADQFWGYARHCLELAEPHAYAPDPVFDLCWRVSDDPRTILRRAVPEYPWVRASYVSYLTALKKTAPATEAWRTLDAGSKASPTGPSLALCDLLIAQGNVEPAIEVWNGAHGGRPLDPAQGRSLTDGNLEHEPTGRGFDWTLPRTSGVDNQYLAEEKEVRVELDGNQPENVELLTQNVPVAPGARYRLRFQYQTAEIAPGSGLAWVPMDALTNAAGASTCASLASPESTTGACEFQAGPSQRLVRVALHYGRALGTLHARGTLRISQVRLDRIG